MAGCCEHNNEPSGSVKCREFIDLLGNAYILKRVSAPLSVVVSIF